MTIDRLGRTLPPEYEPTTVREALRLVTAGADDR
jgi:hypothetical protein